MTLRISEVLYFGAVWFSVSMLASASFAHAPVFHDVSPDTADWCAVINTVAAPGDVVRLASGDYPGGCVIFNTGRAGEGEPLALVGAMDGPARLIGDASQPVITVFGDLVRLSRLHFLPAAGQAAVAGHGSLVVDGCTFEGGAHGLDLRNASGNLSSIRNAFFGVESPIDFTCATDTCGKTGAIIRDNLVLAPNFAPPTSAYAAIQVQTTEEALVVDNVVEGSWRTALKVTGPANVAQNLVLGGAVGLELDQGRAENNIVMGTREAALCVVELAKGRVGGRSGPSVAIIGNTWIPAQGVAVQDPAGRATQLANAFVAGPGDAAEGVACELDLGDCWENAPDGDLRPSAKSRLLGAGPSSEALPRDFCRRRRAEGNAAGALARHEDAAMRVSAISKTKSGCFAVLGPPAPGAPAVINPEASGCSASTARPNFTLLAAILIVAHIRQRRRTDHVIPTR